MSDYVECKVCYKNFRSIECQSVCNDCQMKILKCLGVKCNEEGEVITEEHQLLSNFIYQVSQFGGYIDCLLHALENHTHGTKTVNTVDVE